ncbi:hypothetical protein [Micromonospora sp. LA-10]|uniref:hypothetical protein n=1 Tax=Micromonospora sp. LA-10 TaxID=3446364 RepID=UPI003F72A7D7
MRSRAERLKLSNGDLVAIAADAAVVGPEAEGRVVPVLILDTSERIDVEEAIRVHAHVQPGDVTYQWGMVDGNPDMVVLLLDFVRPIALRAAIGFSIESQAILVESALTAKAIYVQAGKPGDRFSRSLNRPRILIDMPYDDFRDRWDKIVIKRMSTVFREKYGSPRALAKRQAQQLLEETRKFTRLRIPPR